MPPPRGHGAGKRARPLRDDGKRARLGGGIPTLRAHGPSSKPTSSSTTRFSSATWGAACAAIRAAIADGKPICVHGDYDVDGICATEPWTKQPWTLDPKDQSCAAFPTSNCSGFISLPLARTS